MPEEIIRRKRRLSSFQIIILGFAAVILLGGTAADAAVSPRLEGM